MTRVDVIRWRCCQCPTRGTALTEAESDRDQVNHARSVHPDVWYGPKQATPGPPPVREVR